jgi:hypothetical protein
MHSTSKKLALGFCTISFVLTTGTLSAQVNYLGGRNDGFARDTYSQPDPSSDIFSGGRNDGFAKEPYLEPDPSNDIYQGGIQDGFAKASYSEPDPANEIYAGGINDGFAFNSFSQPDPATDIYMGGINDGFAFNSYSQPNPSFDIYGGGINDGFAKFFFSEELALPVEWKYFTVTKKNAKPFLQWAADKEESCMSYEVLRSPDAKNFESITSIACQGNAIDNEYEYEDHSPLWYPILYYKIAQYDVDGQFTYSQVKAFIAGEPSEPEVFYNNGKLIVKTEREAKLYSVSVFDFTGRTLCKELGDREDQSFYTINCQLNPNQLVIIQLTFDSFTHTSYMRLRE